MSKCLGSCPMCELLEHNDKEASNSYVLYVCNNCGILIKYNDGCRRLIINTDNTTDSSGYNDE